MGSEKTIVPPQNSADEDGARRVFDDFVTLYQPEFSRVDYYLEQVVAVIDPRYAEAYRPWYRALRTLIRGAYLVARDIPLPDKAGFLDALRTFSFDGAIHFLRDICIGCRMALKPDWAERFREHIDLLLFSFSILNRQQEPARTR